MTKSILYTFDSTNDRQDFIDLVNNSINNSTEEIKSKFTNIIENYKLDPSIVSSNQRHCGVWVSGKKIIEGDYKSMNERFMQECGVHSASVILKELKNNEWCDIRTRRLQ